LTLLYRESLPLGGIRFATTRRRLMKIGLKVLGGFAATLFETGNDKALVGRQRL
jgi:hypothetical protein